MKVKLLFIVIVFIISKNMQGSCGSSSCPIHVSNQISQGFLSFNLSHEYIYQNQVYVGSSKSFIGAVPGHHDEVSTLNQITALSLDYGAFDFLRINFSVPFIHREHSHIHNHHGEQIWQNWNFSGMGDAAITGSVSVLEPGDNSLSLELLAGVKLPTGVTDIKNQNGEEAEITIQPGSGSTDLILGATLAKDILTLSTLSGSAYAALPMSISGSYRINRQGTADYKFGNELLLHFSTAYRFIEKISFLIQVNARFQEHSDVGLTGELQENTGGKWIFISPGLKFYLSDLISLYGYFQLPVYQNVNGIQQTAPYNLRIGINNEISLFN